MSGDPTFTLKHHSLGALWDDPHKVRDKVTFFFLNYFINNSMSDFV